MDSLAELTLAKRLYLVVLATLVVAVETTVASDFTSRVATYPSFELFKKQFSKGYSTENSQEDARLHYNENIQALSHRQVENPHANYQITIDFDQSMSKFHAVRNGKNADHYAAKMGKSSSQHKVSLLIPDGKINFVDWRQKGVITPVSNQGNCASCWAFVAAANLASHWAISKNLTTPVPLSEQELLSCDGNTGNDACGGGEMTQAYEWYIASQKGNAVTQESYPYVSGGDGIVPKCGWKDPKMGANIQTYETLPQNENAIAAYLALNGPVGVGINDEMLTGYSGGVITGCSNASSGINHAVLLVGYNDLTSLPYWIVKNSWGPTFGMDGYFYLGKGTNQCGVNYMPSAPVVDRNATIAPTNAPLPQPSPRH